MIHKAKKHAKKHGWWLILLALGCALLVWGPTVYAKLSTHGERYNLGETPISKVPKRHVGLVFGAGLFQDKYPTPYLRWRIETAVQLYKAKKVDKLVMTGDNGTKVHNEPKIMRDRAILLGVPAKDIVLDYAGFNTYDSCYRAHAIFKIDSATVVTQGYHLPRAIMACRAVGIDTIGVAAEHSGRDYTASYIIREWVATDKVAFQAVFKPNPQALGRAEPIDQ
jgi:vancomycin permeability regulator SanA